MWPSCQVIATRVEGVRWLVKLLVSGDKGQVTRVWPSCQVTRPR